MLIGFVVYRQFSGNARGREAGDSWGYHSSFIFPRLTGYSPFQGETHQETFYNVSMCEYDFDDEMFDAVSSDAKDFIKKLLVRSPQ